MTTVVAVDAGQGGTRAMVLAADGTVLATGNAAGVAHLGARHGPSCTARAIISAMQAALGDRTTPDAAVIAVSGWTRDESRRDELATRLRRYTDIPRLLLTSDAVAGFFAAPPDRRGVSLSVGTGSVAVAADGSGAWAFVDGVGHLLGDVGSGFWIGQRGLANSLAVADGRGGSEVLLRAATSRFGDPEAIPDLVYGSMHPPSTVAGFATDVIAAAGAGDPLAWSIVHEAGEALALTAISAGDRIFGRAPISVALTGGVVGETGPLVDELASALQANRPGSTIVQHGRQPLDGAALLALEPHLLTMWFPGLVTEARQ